MMPGRWLIVAAAAAALFGAPLRVSGAGNELSAPTVAPASGTTATAFVLSVDYDGRFPALSVEVGAAGVSVPMTLVSGSLVTGGTPSSDGGAADPAPGGAATTAGEAAVSESPAAGAPIVAPASAGVASSVEPEPASDENQVEAEEAAETPIVVGVAGLVAVALIATRLVLLGRRRRIRDDALAATASAADTSAALERRTLRRARLRLGEDPVILALGIPTERERGPQGRTMTIDRDDAARRDSLS